MRKDVRTPKNMTNHFLRALQKRPEILADFITRPKNPGTFVQKPQKVVGHFFAERFGHFSDFSNFLEGRLPPEDGSDRAENLTRSVSDESAKNIFLARQKKSGCHFSNFPSILGFLQFERFDIWASCSSSV